MIIIAGLVIVLSNNQFVIAGCQNVCLSLDSAVYNPNDTTYIESGGNVRIFARYNGACRLIMEGANPTMQLVWYKDGVPYDTTTLTDATYDNIWTYYTSFYVTEPGVYEVYFMGFYQPNYPCGRIYVLPEEEIQSTQTMQSVIPEAAGIENEEVKNGYRIYPNPTSEGYFYIDNLSDLNINNIEVYSIGGQKVLSIVPNGSEILTINTLDFRPGIYIIRIDSEKGITNEKILVK